MKVLHIITGLGMGGAEFMLHRLVSQLEKNNFENIIISLTDEGVFGERIKALDIPLYSLNMRFGLLIPKKMIAMINLIRKEKPDIIQTWMYHADLLGGLCGRMVGIKRILWNIHNTRLGLRYNKLTTLLIVKICAWLSRWLPTKIISCSQAAMEAHIKIGYARDKFVVIPNGVDSSIFHPNAEARRDVRRELLLKSTTPLVGLIARYAPIKDHGTFFKAVSMLARTNPDVHFLLCGEGMTKKMKN